jgi:hypothetical protein
MGDRNVPRRLIHFYTSTGSCSAHCEQIHTKDNKLKDLKTQFIGFTRSLPTSMSSISFMTNPDYYWSVYYRVEQDLRQVDQEAYFYRQYDSQDVLTVFCTFSKIPAQRPPSL